MKDLNIVALPDVQEIEAQAAHWLVILDRGDLSACEQREFESWYHNNNLHQTALLKMSELWGGLGPLLERAAVQQRVVQRSRKANTRRLWGGAVAAMVLVIFGMAVLFTPNHHFEKRYQTVKGEQQTVILPDGSELVVNTESSIDVLFTEVAREVFLEKGEVFFSVAKDSRRPFSVRTDRGVVTAIGTAFSVSLQPENIDVLVTEGRVALNATHRVEPQQDFSAFLAHGVEVSAGQAVVFDQAADTIAVVDPVQLKKKTDWHDGLLVFKGETLEDVIVEVSKYTDTQIDIVDDSLKDKKVVVFYQIGDINELLEALNLMSFVDVDIVSDTHVRLRSQG